MKRFVIWAAACVSAVCSMILVYMTVMKAIEKDDKLLLYVIAALLSLALTSAVICISSLDQRIEFLEHDVKELLDDGYEQEEAPKKECPFCHAFIDEDEDICPYCRNEGAERNGAERFETDDPDYKGTDFSGEPYVSAHTDDK